MQSIIINEKLDYDGSQISSLWGYIFKDIKEDSIIAFRGACDISLSQMIDLEDKKNNESIYSNDMLHFIIEHFDSTDLKLIYTRQRLFTTIVQTILLKYNINSNRLGDDLFIKNGNRKLTISIASVSPVSQKIHFGMNVTHEKYGNLIEMGIIENNITEILKEITDAYKNEIEDIEMDLRKSRPLSVL
ncbi:MAG: DUF366 family protein [Methanosarcinales archaeon]|nr:DUF366 family protein [Methanosarcinales archaeon]